MVITLYREQVVRSKTINEVNSVVKETIDETKSKADAISNSHLNDDDLKRMQKYKRSD